MLPDIPDEIQNLIWTYVRSRLQYERVVREINTYIAAYERDCVELGDGDPPAYGEDWQFWFAIVRK